MQAEQNRRKLKKAQHCPTNDDELREWLRDVLGLTYAPKATEDGHRTLFEFIADVFFNRVDKALVRAPRGAGKTIGFAAIYLLKTYFNERYDIAHIGGTEQQSKLGYAYYAGDPEKEKNPGFIRRPPFDALLADSIVSKTSLRNGSSVEIRTGGSMKSVSGLHPILLGCDELDHIDMQVLSTALNMPMSSGPYQAQTLMGSSQYFNFGTLQMMVDEADQRGIEVYEFDLFDVMESCGRDYPSQCENCPLYTWINPFLNQEEELCLGRGARSSGHISYRDACNKIMMTTTMEDFALQNLLLRGTSQGMVYSTFSEGHVRRFPAEDFNLKKWNCFAGVDLRSNGRIVVIAESPDILPSGKRLRWVIDEWSDNSATPSKIRSAAFTMREKTKAKYGLDIRTFWMESAAADEAADWKAMGLNGKIIPKEFRHILYRIGQVRDAFMHATGCVSLYIDPCCSGLIYALSKGYHCKRRPDGTFDRDVPDSAYSHFPDALGYGYVGGPGSRPGRMPDHDTRGGWWDVGSGGGKWAPY